MGENIKEQKTCFERKYENGQIIYTANRYFIQTGFQYSCQSNHQENLTIG